MCRQIDTIHSTHHQPIFVPQNVPVAVGEVVPANSCASILLAAGRERLMRSRRGSNANSSCSMGRIHPTGNNSKPCNTQHSNQPAGEPSTIPEKFKRSLKQKHYISTEFHLSLLSSSPVLTFTHAFSKIRYYKQSLTLKVIVTTIDALEHI